MDLSYICINRIVEEKMASDRKYRKEIETSGRPVLSQVKGLTDDQLTEHLRIRDLALAALADAVEQPLPDSDADRALAFWECLRVTIMKHQIPETLLHQARRRMKALHPEFHHLYMNRGF